MNDDADKTIETPEPPRDLGVSALVIIGWVLVLVGAGSAADYFLQVLRPHDDRSADFLYLIAGPYSFTLWALPGALLVMKSGIGGTQHQIAKWVLLLTLLPVIAFVGLLVSAVTIHLTSGWFR